MLGLSPLEKGHRRITQSELKKAELYMSDEPSGEAAVYRMSAGMAFQVAGSG